MNIPEEIHFSRLNPAELRLTTGGTEILDALEGHDYIARALGPMDGAWHYGVWPASAAPGFQLAAKVANILLRLDEAGNPIAWEA